MFNGSYKVFIKRESTFCPFAALRLCVKIVARKVAEAQSFWELAYVFLNVPGACPVNFLKNLEKFEGS